MKPEHADLCTKIILQIIDRSNTGGISTQQIIELLVEQIPTGWSLFDQYMAVHVISLYIEQHLGARPVSEVHIVLHDYSTDEPFTQPKGTI